MLHKRISAMTPTRPTPDPSPSPGAFFLCPAACLPPVPDAHRLQQQALYEWAYRQAREVVRPSDPLAVGPDLALGAASDVVVAVGEQEAFPGRPSLDDEQLHGGHGGVGSLSGVDARPASRPGGRGGGAGAIFLRPCLDCLV